MNEWSRLEPELRARAYGTIEADPRYLLETDATWVPAEADLWLARLLANRRPRWIEETPDLELRTAAYHLQSGWAATSVSAIMCPPPPGVRLSPDGTFRIAYLRYRRRCQRRPQ
jgi:hypothetical protein